MEKCSLTLEKVECLKNELFTGEELLFFPSPDGRIFFVKKDTTDIRIMTEKGKLAEASNAYRLGNFIFSQGGPEIKLSVRNIFFLDKRVAFMGQFAEGGIAFFDEKGNFQREFVEDFRLDVSFSNVFFGGAVFAGKHLFCFGKDILYNRQKYGDILIEENGRVTPNIFPNYQVIEATALESGLILVIALNKKSSKTEIFILNDRKAGMIDSDLNPSVISLFKEIAPAINLEAKPIISVCPEGRIFIKLAGNYFKEYKTPHLVVLRKNFTLDEELMNILEEIDINFGSQANVHYHSQMAHLSGKKYLFYGPGSLMLLFNFNHQSEKLFQSLVLPKDRREDLIKSRVIFVRLVYEEDKILLAFYSKGYQLSNSKTEFFWAKIH